MIAELCSGCRSTVTAQRSKGLMNIVIDIMIFAGAALMVWNILRYNKYMRSTMEYGDWEGNEATLLSLETEFVK